MTKIQDDPLQYASGSNHQEVQEKPKESGFLDKKTLEFALKLVQNNHSSKTRRILKEELSKFNTPQLPPQPTYEDSWEDKFEQFLNDDFVAEGIKGQNETHRWMFCHDFDGTPVNDCACCLDGGLNRDRCSCICHNRINQIKSFIRHLLKSERGRLVREIEGIIKERIESLEKRAGNQIMPDDPRPIGKRINELHRLLTKLK